MMTTRLEQLKKLYHGLGKGAKRFVPFGVLILSLLLTTVSFYALQLYGDDQPLLDYDRYRQDACVDAHRNGSFGKAFYFVSTVFSTIGYGDVVPCTWPGKLLTVITALIGVPLTLFCLGKLGQYMAVGANYLWRRTQRFTRLHRLASIHRASASSIHRSASIARSASAAGVRGGADGMSATTDVGEGAEGDTYLPLPIGIIVTVAWILVSALFFQRVAFHNLAAQTAYVHDHWTYLDAVYYTIISLFTIGLGDYYPTDHTLDVLTFLFIFVGLALVSMCIALATKRMESQMDKMVKMIQKAYEKNNRGALPPNLSEEDQRMAKLILGLWNDEEMSQSGSVSPGFNNPFARPKTPASTKQMGKYVTKLVLDKWKSKALRNHSVGTQTNWDEVNDVFNPTHTTTLPSSTTTPADDKTAQTNVQQRTHLPPILLTQASQNKQMTPSQNVPSDGSVVREPRAVQQQLVRPYTTTTVAAKPPPPPTQQCVSNGAVRMGGAVVGRPSAKTDSLDTEAATPCTVTTPLSADSNTRIMELDSKNAQIDEQAPQQSHTNITISNYYDDVIIDDNPSDCAGDDDSEAVDDKNDLPPRPVTAMSVIHPAVTVAYSNDSPPCHYPTANGAPPALQRIFDAQHHRHLAHSNEYKTARSASFFAEHQPHQSLSTPATPLPVRELQREPGGYTVGASPHTARATDGDRCSIYAVPRISVIPIGEVTTSKQDAASASPPPRPLSNLSDSSLCSTASGTTYTTLMLPPPFELYPGFKKSKSASIVSVTDASLTIIQ